MAAFKTLDDLDAGDKRVLVRIDVNVPTQDGRVTDATRIQRAARTLRELADAGARVVALSHFGRPKGRAQPSMSLAPIAEVMSEVIGKDVAFASDCVGETAEKAVGELAPGSILLLENLRFHAGEEQGDPAFAQALAKLGDAYVNDAFSCSHRAHASITGVAELLPAYGGRLMLAELVALDAALEKPERPVAALVGGAKISTKLEVLRHLIDKVDLLVIGGGMANTFLAARGEPVGKSLCEHDLGETAREILDLAESKETDVILPGDALTATEFKAGAPAASKPIGAVEPQDMILDIGPSSIAAIAGRLEGCRTLLWNGPLGAFEIEPFDRGTTAVARKAAELTDAGKLVTVAGGGDTVAALSHAGVLQRFSYVSTAGGAFLEWIEGKKLPGIAALERR